jgi:uroporphyrinogen-III decarboxylase
VDPRVIEFGTRAEVEGEVRRCLKDAAVGGGFMLSTSANVSANSNTSNFVHMLKYAKEIGQYPITLG